ncbi:MAG: polymer-forming cytoskeletal protein [Phycisphaerae bacterium]|nr:polymer-forming cytoskeletal protein [Phycisphaerae bacterium]
MPSGPGTRQVVCVRCTGRFEVPAPSISASCPRCHRQVSVTDVVVRNTRWGGSIQTCGRVLVYPGGALRSLRIEAADGVEVLGSIDADVTSGGPVLIGPGATWRGNLSAPAVEIRPGATILSGAFRIGAPAAAIAAAG